MNSRIRATVMSVLLATFSLGYIPLATADSSVELLKLLVKKGILTQEEAAPLIASREKALDTGSSSQPALVAEQNKAVVTTTAEVEEIVERKVSEAVEQKLDKNIDTRMDKTISEQIAKKVEKDFPIKASHGSKGFRLETRDGNWQTNLQWRAQLRYTNPTSGDPRQIDNFENDPESTFEARRLRMKIGGHGFRPWIGYYFEVDLQPSRDVDDSSSASSARVIDWRLTLDKWDWAALRVGQWKIDHNRERVDSSGRQQFVERSIVNRIFTIDRQVGAQLRGHLFKNTAADMRYWAGVYTGEGRSVHNDDDSMMWAGRLQWNFLGRDLAWKQTDVEYTKLPTGSLAFSAMTNKGRCTRWSSGGCGNLDGFTRPADALEGQFKVEQMMQEFAFKWHGLSLQQEFHWKTVEDRVAGTKSDFTGAYAQAGYFFHHLIPTIPESLEFAFRYAFVEEPNEVNRAQENRREEFTLGANWFFAGHNNKLTADFSHLTLEDEFFSREVKDNRVRVQWDVSF